MAAVIIRSKDVKRLAEELVKEIFDFLHDEYILTTFPDMKVVKEKFLRNLVLKNFRYFNVTEIKKPNSFELKYEKFDENKFEDELKYVKEQIKKGTLNTHVLFKTLLDLNLDMEIDEDLYFKHKSFLDIYKVFETGYTYLED